MTSRKKYEIELTEKSREALKMFGITGDPSAFISGLVRGHFYSVCECLDAISELDKKIEKEEARLKFLKEERKAIELMKDRKMRHLDDPVPEVDG